MGRGYRRRRQTPVEGVKEVHRGHVLGKKSKEPRTRGERSCRGGGPGGPKEERTKGA